MPKVESLVNRLSLDHPSISFQAGDCFKWSPSTQTIVFDPNTTSATLLLLHEVAHMLLEHNDYKFDIELLKREVEAWDLVKTALSAKYNVKFNSNLVEDIIDSYRDWLHSRSLCPNCQSIGSQIATKTYYCSQCGHKWRVNSAKFSELRRHLIN